MWLSEKGVIWHACFFPKEKKGLPAKTEVRGATLCYKQNPLRHYVK